MHPPIRVRGGQRGIGGRDPFEEDIEVGADLRGGTGVIGFWYPRNIFFFDVTVVETVTDTYLGVQLHYVLTHNERCKTGKYLEAYLEHRLNFTPLVFLLDGVMV